jgi:hypothetical protein
MKSLADTDAGMTRLAGLMSLDLGRAGGKALGGVLALGRTTGGLLGETVLNSYAESLGQVRRRGLAACMEEAAQPYLKGFLKQYRRGQTSWTERLIAWISRRLGRASTG